MLFPSRECRDWSQFVPPMPKTEPKPVFNFFKPFDKVLVRDGDDYFWEIDFFAHCNPHNNFPFRVMTSGCRKQCIPYEGNEHLHRTNNKPNE